eukprot:CAMPEP_0118709088 /NCGR_PEP_ID=MMETSP0800-20121206/22381_1 /TAXON_ID=210618 ORGANISM="Striatella unipunctata, Strain CCMP2910" /NCGR_SAMPLE_ID=MMETSP0800 /ASSEMBLY_ACC=CAM_ASM_000638 /LENGTH=209 /DNA_ID=CAMNT_0006612619 /DNA_START=137 /DNA_END=763 /DNA_ORIENTATION=+
MQRRERKSILIAKGDVKKAEEIQTDDEDESDAAEKAGLASAVGEISDPMTSQLSAALLIESLYLNPFESVEGMAKCYDGIVQAGVALLDSEVGDDHSTVNDNRPRPSRSEIMAALEPLLITSLEQPSGETILFLARLRRMCGTARYQRRFVQRIGPVLVSPKGAIWCLRHQNDMEPIIAALEMIFDAAFEVFNKGWYERGRLLLADSVR